MIDKGYGKIEEACDWLETITSVNSQKVHDHNVFKTALEELKEIRS